MSASIPSLIVVLAGAVSVLFFVAVFVVVGFVPTRASEKDFGSGS